MTKPKFCVDCKHFCQGIYNGSCLRVAEEKYDLVFGICSPTKTLRAKDERESGECGIEAKFFEPLHNPVPQPYGTFVPLEQPPTKIHAGRKTSWLDKIFPW